ncbi:MAG: hypothetical protein IAB81_01220 [Bacteroidetes bacterium]|uniref:Uncharacterized protein n=1 Tax=Candidatus Merdivivens pullicola TaxID=2840872 RepID=A0A9D9IGF3_9BACT|nr:hypothetical protein [Candidatus Merdivivens pullicola]
MSGIEKYPQIAESHILTQNELEETLGGCCGDNCKSCDEGCKSCEEGHKNKKRRGLVVVRY